MLFAQGNIGPSLPELLACEQSTLSACTCWSLCWRCAGCRRSLLSYDGLDASRALAFFNDEAVEQDEESLSCDARPSV